MQNRDRPKPVILPVRMSVALYQALAVMAVRDERNRCSMIRKLIADAARRGTREETAHGRMGQAR